MCVTMCLTCGIIFPLQPEETFSSCSSKCASACFSVYRTHSTARPHIKCVHILYTRKLPHTSFRRIFPHSSSRTYSVAGMSQCVCCCCCRLVFFSRSFSPATTNTILDFCTRYPLRSFAGNSTASFARSFRTHNASCAMRPYALHICMYVFFFGWLCVPSVACCFGGSYDKRTRTT